jgi:hypothetical protein
MTVIHPQFITDNNGNKISAVIPINEFKTIMEELEDAEDVKLYDEAKKEDNGERILFSDYVKNRKEKNA